MREAWFTFRSGLTHATRHRRLLIVLFAANLLSALMLMALPATSLVAPAYGTAIQDAADGIDTWMVIETLMGPLALTELETETPAMSGSLGPFLGWLSLSALALPLLASLPRAFLTGGTLLIYKETPQPLRWRRFLWGCWHWFGAFLLLTLLQGIALLVLIPLGLTALVVTAATGSLLVWVTVPVLAFFALFWLAVTELTRIVSVMTETRNIAKAFAAALRLIFDCPLQVLGLYALALALLGLIHALFRGAILPFVPPQRWLLFFLIQQIFVVAQLWARLARLAGGNSLYSRLRTARAATLPEADA
jgi:hypothetical protein